MLAGGSHMCPPTTCPSPHLHFCCEHSHNPCRELKADIASQMLCDVDSDSIQTLAPLTRRTQNWKPHLRWATPLNANKSEPRKKLPELSVSDQTEENVKIFQTEQKFGCETASSLLQQKNDCLNHERELRSRTFDGLNHGTGMGLGTRRWKMEENRVQEGK